MNKLNSGINVSPKDCKICDPHAHAVYGMKYLQFKFRQRTLSFFTNLKRKSLVKLDKNNEC